MGVLQFDEGPDFSRAQVVGCFALLSVGEEDLTNSFAIAGGGIHQGVPRFELARVDAEKGEGSDMLFDQGFENEDDGLCTFHVDLDGVTGRRFAVDGFAIKWRGAKLGDEIHQAPDADIVVCTRAEKWSEGLALNGLVQMFAKFVFTQFSLVEVGF